MNFFKTIFTIIILASSYCPKSVYAENSSTDFEFSKRYISIINDFYKYYSIDDEFDAGLSRFVNNADEKEYLSLQSLISKNNQICSDILITAKDLAMDANQTKTLLGRSLYFAANNLCLETEILKAMFKDGNAKNIPNLADQRIKISKEAWVTLLRGVAYFPFVIQELLGADEIKKKINMPVKDYTGPIFYKISESERKELLALTDSFFSKIKDEAIKSESDHADPNRQKPVIYTLILKIYESIEYQTYGEYKENSVTEYSFKMFGEQKEWWAKPVMPY